MKTLTLFLLLFFSSCSSIVYSQNPLGILKETKSSIELKMNFFKMVHNPSTKEYQISYPKYRDLYMEIYPKYEGYRGELVYCAVTKSSRKNFEKCIMTSATNFSSSLKKLDNFFVEEIKQKGIAPMSNAYSGTPIPIADIIAGLVEGGIKVWKHIEDKTAEQKEEFKKEVKLSEYNLKPMEELIPLPSYKDK